MDLTVLHLALPSLTEDAAVLLRNVRMGTEDDSAPESEPAPTAVPLTDLE